MHKRTISLESENVKMADLLARHNQLVALLPRLGISLGFGEKTIRQVCDDNQVSLPLFALVCKTYTREEFTPDIEELRQCKMSDIVKYLMACHEDYLQFQFPHIEKHLREVVQNWEDRYKSSILRFFLDYKNEVQSHFKYEEDVVFPYIQSLMKQNGSKNESFRISDFEQQHSNIDDKLRDLTHLMIKYIPANVAQRERVYMLMDVFTLADDFAKHELIEERILLPYIKDLESYENK